MARTLNPVAHAVRRDAFVDSAQRLIVSKGYDGLSVQDVLAEVGCSKGAFYHYFDSKEALLSAVVDRIAATAIDVAAPIVADPDLTALQKLKGVFDAIGQFKGERKDLMLAIVHVWLSDSNIVVREQLRRSGASRLTPLLTEIVRQGRAEGAFRVAAPEPAADVLVALILGLQESGTRLFLEREAGRVSYEECLSTYSAYQQAFDRILGIPDGTCVFVDEEVFRFWFD